MAEFRGAHVPSPSFYILIGDGPTDQRATQFRSTKRAWLAGQEPIRAAAFGAKALIKCRLEISLPWRSGAVASSALAFDIPANDPRGGETWLKRCLATGNPGRGEGRPALEQSLAIQSRVRRKREIC